MTCPDNGNAVYNVTSGVSAGNLFAVRGWVNVTGTETTTVRITAKLACAGETDQYIWLHNNSNVVPNTWTRMSGFLDVPETCNVTEALTYSRAAPRTPSRLGRTSAQVPQTSAGQGWLCRSE